jgi:hypothetical protein
VSTPAPPHVDHVEAAAQAVIADVVSWVRGHPAYGQIVEALGSQAIHVLAASAGIAL